MPKIAELRGRAWKSQADAPSVVIMQDPPKDWRIWVFADIDVSYKSDFDDDIDEDDDEETPESKAKDRSRPWVVRTSRRGTVAVNIGPRHERLSDALGWAEGFADDLDVAAGKHPAALGLTSGSA